MPGSCKILLEFLILFHEEHLYIELIFVGKYNVTNLTKV